MNRKFYTYSPWNFYFVLFLVAVFLLIFPLMILIFADGVVEAFGKLGFSPATGALLFFLSLIGSMINIPVKEIDSEEQIVQVPKTSAFGVTYVLPQLSNTKTIVALNIGGGLIPIFIAVYEVIRISRLDFAALFSLVAATIVVALVTHFFAKPIRGVGIAIPFLIPPIITVVATLLLGKSMHPAIAYVSGTIGTLIGADLSNLNKISSLGAPVASIGGAGTFDGIFLAGILSVLLI
ncbi:MAG: DUF1614 domain-containing protein [Caldisericaceae bacterium]